LTTVSIRITRPSLGYCLILECLQDTLSTTWPVSGPVDGRAEDAFGVAADAPAEDDLDVGRASDVEVVSDQRLKERPAGPPGSVEHQGAGHLDLAYGDLPPVPGPLVGAGEWHRQTVQPLLGEHLDDARPHPRGRDWRRPALATAETRAKAKDALPGGQPLPRDGLQQLQFAIVTR
jgi:hypothetical protein